MALPRTGWEFFPMVPILLLSLEEKGDGNNAQEIGCADFFH